MVVWALPDLRVCNFCCNGWSLSAMQTLIGIYGSLDSNNAGRMFAVNALTNWRTGSEAMTFTSCNICVFCGCGNVNSRRWFENGKACSQLYPLVQIEFGCCICLSFSLFLFQPRLLYETNWVFFSCVGTSMFSCDCSLPSSCFRSLEDGSMTFLTLHVNN